MRFEAYRAKAPLRIGLGGGGTDIPAYSEKFGGAVLNATISMFAYASIEPLEHGKIVFHAADKNEYLELSTQEWLEPNGKFDLLKGIYNRIVKEFSGKPLSFKLTTYVDAPPGSGLGSSSTLVVSAIGAFVEWLKLPLGEYDIASLAYEIEREDLGYLGGKQDQYAATFGGFNFIEFNRNKNVIVNPLRIKYEYTNELEFKLILFYTDTSRLSSRIIEVQTENIMKEEPTPLEALHEMKRYAFLLKEALLTGSLDNIGQILHHSWECKKRTAAEVSSLLLDEIYETALKAGAAGGKISGAGGGGFMLFYCPENTRYHVIKALLKFGGEFRSYSFVRDGLTTWTA